MAHELAHAWFGNLVTPRFWDALWLKEGFATFFAFFVADALEPNANWKSRFLVRESVPAKVCWLYSPSWVLTRAQAYDGLPMTHALEASVNNSGEATEIFDEISYGKAAALVQTVESYLGGDALRNGVRKYIEQFKFKTAASLDLWLTLFKASRNGLCGGVFQLFLVRPLRDTRDPPSRTS